jgi:UDP:flavonoid glycosyltransferase YjiC (YdhE family)
MPYSHDQPDNARRMRRLKVARVIQRANYTPAKVAAKLKEMMDDPEFGIRSAQVAEQIAHEDGVRSACNALEELFRNTR